MSNQEQPTNQPSGIDPERRAHMLAEMGIGPVWRLREQAIDDQVGKAVTSPAQNPAASPDGDSSAQQSMTSEIEARSGQFVDVQNEMVNAETIDAKMIGAIETVEVEKNDRPSQTGRFSEPLKQGRADDPNESASAWDDDISLPEPTNTRPAVTPLDRVDRTGAIASMDWAELESTVAACRACGLCAGRANTVFGVGDRKAKWLFIGEGPGYNENLQGQPFVGPAGQLLDNMMRALNMQRGEATYIANIVKCRPTDDQGKDRPPIADEVAACLPYLQRQISLIQPEVIVALGKTAAISLLGLDAETPVAQLRGRVHRYADVPLIVTYHPAYLLRKPIEKSKAWIDLCMASSAINSRH